MRAATEPRLLITQVGLRTRPNQTNSAPLLSYPVLPPLSIAQIASQLQLLMKEYQGKVLATTLPVVVTSDYNFHIIRIAERGSSPCRKHRKTHPLCVTWSHWAGATWTRC